VQGDGDPVQFRFGRIIDVFDLQAADHAIVKLTDFLLGEGVGQ
jgi:hypothetical protein